MSETFPFEKRYKYPHMMPYDVAIWERFIEQFPDAYDHVQYDVKVGSAPEHDTIVNTDTGGDALDLYKKKIDVVAYKGDQIDIIELKPNASASACGQVVGYGVLYTKEFNPPTRPKLVVITDAPKRDLGLIAHEMGVTIVVV